MPMAPMATTAVLTSVSLPPPTCTQTGLFTCAVVNTHTHPPPPPPPPAPKPSTPSLTGLTVGGSLGHYEVASISNSFLFIYFLELKQKPSSSDDKPNKRGNVSSWNRPPNSSECSLRGSFFTPKHQYKQLFFPLISFKHFGILLTLIPLENTPEPRVSLGLHW